MNILDIVIRNAKKALYAIQLLIYLYGVLFNNII